MKRNNLMSKTYKSKSKRTCEVFRPATGYNPKDCNPPSWFFRVKRRENGEIIAQSEGYSRRIDCINTAKLVTGGSLKITVIK